MWIFDQSDGSARLLRSRCGHNAPPTRIRFCSTGGDAVKILSGGKPFTFSHTLLRTNHSSCLNLRTGQCPEGVWPTQRCWDEFRAISRYVCVHQRIKLCLECKVGRFSV